MRTPDAGLLGLWLQADSVARATAVVLLVMSIATWYLILVKGLQARRLRREAAAVPVVFWRAATLDAAVAQSHAISGAGPFVTMADEALVVMRAGAAPAVLESSLEQSDRVARCLRLALQRAARKLDAGLTVLASVGATAPFVGLFGTVWGIYHALADIGMSGQVSIDKVAGPVGEALIMTAFGIAVAVPAVIAYNFVLRSNRALAQELDGFTRDLHAYLVRALAAREAQDGATLEPPILNPAAL